MSPLPRSIFVKIAERVYGPYTREQIDGFLREGRLSFKTMASWSNIDGFQPLIELLQQSEQPNTTREENNQVASIESTDEANLSFQAKSEHALHAYLIIADIHTGAASVFEDQILSAGTTVKLMPSTWYLVSEAPLTGLRAQLSRVLPPTDRFIIVDPVRNRMAWHNLGVEVDARLRMARTLAMQS